MQASTKTQTVDKAEYCLKQIDQILKNMGLHLAAQKTQMVILEAIRKVKTAEIRINEDVITNSESVKYLGVYLDKNLRMTTHVKKTVEQAMQIHKTLSRIMPRIGWPS